MAGQNTTIVSSVIVLTGVIAYLMSSTLQGIISRPITALTTTAKLISERRDYSARATKQSNDEVGMLIDAFNNMLDQIQQRDLALVSNNEQLETKVRQRTAELRLSNEQLKQEIMERRKAEESLQALNARLETTVQQLTVANIELRDFAHIIAHDLQTPLRAIAVLADWITIDCSDKLDSTVAENLSLLKKRAKRLAALIEGIREYCELGSIQAKEQVDLNKLVQQIVAEINPPENIRIVILNELPTVAGSKTRLKQVFKNLLTNAVQYMDKPKGEITVSCVEDGDFWKFSICDNGPGIEERHFRKIFKIFQTLHTRDEMETAGLGLAIVKKVVDMYGGTVTVESEVGKGTTFSFTFPRTFDLASKESEATATIS